jgi:hypothetical protein
MSGEGPIDYGENIISTLMMVTIVLMWFLKDREGYI